VNIDFFNAKAIPSLNMYILVLRRKQPLKYNQQNATFSRSIYFYKLFHMFQAVPPTIVSSTKLYIHSVR